MSYPQLSLGPVPTKTRAELWDGARAKRIEEANAYAEQKRAEAAKAVPLVSFPHPDDQPSLVDAVFGKGTF